MAYKVGQIVKSKRSNLERRITKVALGRVFWISKDGKKKGNCSIVSMNSWTTKQ